MIRSISVINHHHHHDLDRNILVDIRSKIRSGVVMCRGLTMSDRAHNAKALKGLMPKINTATERTRLRKPPGYWTRHGGKRIRAFFDDFAKMNGFNPLLASEWYPIKQRHILDAGGDGFLHHFGGSHIKGLITAYPEIGLDEKKFPQNIDNAHRHREFFDGVASAKGIDPSKPTHWYSLTLKDVLSMGGSGVLTYYKGSHITALIELYPELNMKKDDFPTVSGKFTDERKRREFLDSFARKRKFEPLVPENWFPILHKDILAAGGTGLLRYYEGSHIKALIALYPELSLKKTLFKRHR